MKFEHNNISPLDSRYAEKIVPIREAFSEKALIKTRFIIEINWLLFLCNKMPNDFPKLSKISINKILKFRESFFVFIIDSMNYWEINRVYSD